jgi:putative lipoic acid-binding regulatory protein
MTREENVELQFPVECHFRILAENQPNMAFVIETVLMELGVSAPLETANTSANGRYISFNVTTIVESREMMNRIDAELRRILGVRMVM